MNRDSKIDIRQITKEGLIKFFTDNACPKYRAIQAYDWLWKYQMSDFEKMSNLAKSDIKILKLNFYINTIETSKIYHSKDGTIKFLFKLFDNKVVEGVLIPQLNRLTVCISSQVGCSLACEFCATGKLTSFRNLSTGEIYDQAFLINKYCKEKLGQNITNIVFMGMGEPLLNYKNVIQSIEHITGTHGMNMSGKRITVSTAGISKMIMRLADNEPKFGLAISLHSANDIKRNKIMDINKTNNLRSLEKALIYFYEKTKTKPTYEYLLLKDFNDSLKDADELIKFCKKIPCKVNLIEYNKVIGSPFEKSTEKSTSLFIQHLEQNKILVKMRRSRGEDIGAACGQLATQQSE
tara:strand:+ start:591 stop:1640 length:1050 start_codon:yes stop_codon:yes gene_type:complete